MDESNSRSTAAVLLPGQSKKTHAQVNDFKSLFLLSSSSSLSVCLSVCLCVCLSLSVCLFLSFYTNAEVNCDVSCLNSDTNTNFGNLSAQNDFKCF